MHGAAICNLQNVYGGRQTGKEDKNQNTTKVVVSFPFSFWYHLAQTQGRLNTQKQVPRCTRKARRTLVNTQRTEPISRFSFLSTVSILLYAAISQWQLQQYPQAPQILREVKIPLSEQVLETHQGKVIPLWLFPLYVLLMPALDVGIGSALQKGVVKGPASGKRTQTRRLKKSQEDLREGRAWESHSRKMWMHSQALLEAAHA